MYVAINFKICDNIKDCPAMEECPTDAIFWNEKTNSLDVDNSLCTTCYNCEEECAVGAMRVARNEKEYDEIKKEIAEDSSNISDLLVDRYGAQPIRPEFHIPIEKFDKQVLESTKLCVAEIFQWDLVECLISSVPIQNLFGGYDLMYRKIALPNDDLSNKFSVQQLPALLFFNDGEIIGKIEGFYGIEQEKELKDRVNQIFKDNSIIPQYK